MIDLGTILPGSTLRIPFSSFDKDDGSSITMTNYAVADILIYKDGSTTERASTAGYTATTDFDGKTGKHLAIIDLADDTTADFFKAGSEYLVAIDAVTVDAVTTGGWIARFRIGYPGAQLDTYIDTLASQTSFTLPSGKAPAEDDALNGHEIIIHDKASAVQSTRCVIEDYTGSTRTVTLRASPATTFTIAAGDNVSVRDLVRVDLTHILGSAPTEGAAGRLAAAFTKFFDKASPTGTINSIPDAVAGANGGIPTVDAANRIVGLQGTKHTFDDLNDLSQANIRTAVGLASANLDTQIGTLATLTKLLKYVQLLARKDAAIATDNATELTAINANGGSGAGAYDNTTDAQEALRDRGDASWTTVTAAAIRTAVGLASANLDTQIGTLATPAQVNAEVVDALNVDTYPEPGQGTPPATTTLVNKIGYQYKNWRNKKTQTSSQWSLLNDDAATVDQKATVADDGTTASKGEIATGP